MTSFPMLDLHHTTVYSDSIMISNTMLMPPYHFLTETVFILEHNTKYIVCGCGCAPTACVLMCLLACFRMADSVAEEWLPKYLDKHKNTWSNCIKCLQEKEDIRECMYLCILSRLLHRRQDPSHLQQLVVMDFYYQHSMLVVVTFLLKYEILLISI